MIDFDAIKRQRSFSTVTVSATMPASSADVVNDLMTRFQNDPEKLAIVQEMVLVEGAKAVRAQIGGESKPAQKRGRKPKSKQDSGTSSPPSTAAAE